MKPTPVVSFGYILASLIYTHLLAYHSLWVSKMDNFDGTPMILFWKGPIFSIKFFSSNIFLSISPPNLYDLLYLPQLLHCRACSKPNTVLHTKPLFSSSSKERACAWNEQNKMNETRACERHALRECWPEYVFRMRFLFDWVIVRKPWDTACALFWKRVVNSTLLGA